MRSESSPHQPEQDERHGNDYESPPQADGHARDPLCHRLSPVIPRTRIQRRSIRRFQPQAVLQAPRFRAVREARDFLGRDKGIRSTTLPITLHPTLPPAPTLPPMWPHVYYTSVYTNSPPVPEVFNVSPLEKLFRLEIEFHRRLRTAAPGTIIDVGSLHTGFALQTGYEQLIGTTGAVTAQDIEMLRERFFLAGDGRDLLAARDSLRQLLGIRLLDR